MYKAIIFDLDDTLTYERENIIQAFKRVLEYRGEEYSLEDFERFNVIDKKTWKDRAEGKIKTPYDNEKDPTRKIEYIRSSRFLKYYDNKISYEEAVILNNIYIKGMMEEVPAREGAFEIVKYLYDKNYKLIVGTNGPRIPLQSKLEKLKIDVFFDTIFSAEEVGFMKPQKPYFDGLLKKANISENEKAEVLIIGDDLLKDIKGGVINNIDTCWCNYDNIENTSGYIPKYEIKSLKELKEIL